MFKKFLAVLLAAQALLFGACASAQPPYKPVKSKVTVTLKLPRTAMDGTALSGDYVIKSVQLYFSESSIDCVPIPMASLCHLTPTVILYPDNQSTMSYTYVGVPVGGILFVRADVCNVNGCSYLSNQLSISVNKNYTMNITGKKEPAQNFKTDAPPEDPQIIISVQPDSTQ